MTNSICEFEEKSKLIFVIGSNTTACHPLIATRIIKAKENGAKLIVADPREIQLGRIADIAVTQRLGSDVALLNGMMHLIIKNKWHSKEYIETRCEDFEALESRHDLSELSLDALVGCRFLHAQFRIVIKTAAPETFQAQKRKITCRAPAIIDVRKVFQMLMEGKGC